MQKVKEFFANAITALKRAFHTIKNKIVSFYDDKIRPLFKKETSEDDSAFPQVSPQGERSSSTVVFSGAAELKKIQEQPAAEKPSLQPHEYSGKDKILSTAFKKKESRPLFFLGIINTTCKFLIVAIIVIGFACLGGVLGVANAYLGSTPELDLEELQESALTSYIYDSNGNLLTSYSGMENRDYAALSEIPDLLEKAVISTEDVRFYYHGGVDFKRLIRSFVGNMSGGSVSGGSTITQQLIKNQLLTSERSYKRKIQEANLALQLEKKYSKDQILESYLNIIPLGGTNYGVKAAAKDYFGKELNELTLREIACIAGITQYPYAYNPRRCYYGTDDPEVTAKRIASLDFRIDTVLQNMYAAGYITMQERDAAFDDTFTVVEESTTSEMYECAHFVEYAIEDIIDSFIEYRGLENDTANRQSIENELRTAGYRIHLTVDPAMQDIVQTSITEYNYPELKDRSQNVIEQTDGNGNTIEIIQPQAAAVVIDQSTGHVKAMVGSRTTPATRKTLNRAVNNFTLVGSSIKPLAVYGPAMDGGAGLGTIIENITVPIEGWDTQKGYPLTSHGTKSSFGKKYGPVTIRNGIKSSLNIVAGRTLAYHVGLDASYEYMTKIVSDASSLHKDYVGLSLGSSGISMLDLTSGYAAIANGGVYTEPTTFTKITDSKNKVVLTSDDVQDSFRLYEQSTAYMLVSALTDAVRGGTGTNARISGITVAGKTGTVSDNNGVVFAGMTGYYTSCVWTGHDNFKPFKKTSGGSGAAPLWQDYMSKILEGKEDKAILSGEASDYDLVSKDICAASGMLATDACASDTGGHVPYSELFPKNAELEPCTWHVTQTVCSVTSQPAGEFCPIDQITEGSTLILPEESDYFLLPQEELLEIFPNIYLEAEDGQQVTCHLHTADWAEEQVLLNEALEIARAALSDHSKFVEKYEVLLSSKTISSLKKYASALSELIKQASAEPTQAEDGTIIYPDIPSRQDITAATQALTDALSAAKNNIVIDPFENIFE